MVGFARQLVAPKDLLVIPTSGILKHWHPLKLISVVSFQIRLVWCSDIEQRLGFILNTDLRDLQWIYQLIRSELEASGRDLAVKRTVRLFLHLRRVDLHHSEDPLFLDVEIERRFIT